MFFIYIVSRVATLRRLTTDRLLTDQSANINFLIILNSKITVQTYVYPIVHIITIQT